MITSANEAKAARDGSFTRIFVTFPEVAAALAPEAAAPGDAAVGRSIATVSPSVAQPAYDENMRRLERRHLGMAGVADLHAHFVGREGNRGLWLDRDAVERMSGDAAFAEALRALRVLSAPREARNAERLERLRSNRVARAAARGAPAESLPAPVEGVVADAAPAPGAGRVVEPESLGKGFVLVTFGELQDGLDGRGPVAAVASAVSQPAMRLVGSRLTPTGDRLSGAEGIENLISCFGERPDALRRLWLDDAELALVTADGAAASALADLRTLSDARVAEIGANRAAKRAARETTIA